LRILRERPEWLEEMRRLILTEELLKLPAKFDSFVKEEFKPLKEKVGILEEDTSMLKQDVSVLKQDVAVLKQDVSVLKQDVSVLKQDVAVLKQDVAVLKQDVAVLKQDVAYLKGAEFERTVRERAPAYLGRLIRRCRSISFEELADKLEDAVDEGIITENDKDDAMLVDAVAKGLIKKTGRIVILALEVSLKVDTEDVQRAAKRANTIGKAFNTETIAVALGKDTTKKAKKKAEELNVVVL